MLRHNGGERAKAGFYWNPTRWEIIPAKKGDTLPGGEETGYYKIPFILVLLLGPLMGALYVGFLPLIGFGLFFGFVGRKLFHVLGKAAGTVVEKLTTLREDEG